MNLARVAFNHELVVPVAVWEANGTKEVCWAWVIEGMRAQQRITGGIFITELAYELPERCEKPWCESLWGEPVVAHYHVRAKGYVALRGVEQVK